MKSMQFKAWAILGAALLLAGTAQAGQREGAFSLSPMVGYHIFEGDQNTDDDFVAGFSLGYNVSKRWAAELEFRLTPTETDLNTGSNYDIDAFSVGANALYHFNPDGPFVPYVSAGFGILFFSDDGYDDDGDYMMNYGVGAKYFFTDDAAFRVDLRHLVDFHSDRPWDHGGGAQVDNNLLATAGFYMQFGGVTPPPPPPPDSDGDGIPDLRDKCPDTPPGVMVDAVGCPPVPKPAPAPAPKPAPAPVPPPPPVVEKPAPAPVTKEIITFNLLFGFDKYAITDEMIPVLEQAKSILEEDSKASFMVLGHTCNIGTDEYNQKLSERRANSVREWLVSNGIAASRLEMIGYGESQPKYDNNTKDGRKLNRRVEIQTH